MLVNAERLQPQYARYRREQDRSLPRHRDIGQWEVCKQLQGVVKGPEWQGVRVNIDRDSQPAKDDAGNHPGNDGRDQFQIAAFDERDLADDLRLERLSLLDFVALLRDEEVVCPESDRDLVRTVRVGADLLGQVEVELDNHLSAGEFDDLPCEIQVLSLLRLRWLDLQLECRPYLEVLVALHSQVCLVPS